ncbi:hypothetical protein PSEUBRA_003983 [Kalmanozyma brasiliensis GHG001]|uniref:uncharacterized protein n=1 Tax=Kalmanozyma brasiliensis (strain GHG001) TaxID=1365824 RepID=UPI002867CD20|nr:uncharacterized protein PSEUBRA_003983 [Kalmanozyma brasiliensis GHG001]KAF6767322.1 hypothetical protein PSEUBRA_003983 [Kalmanozyma brasiliensis GHG001]
MKLTVNVNLLAVAGLFSAAGQVCGKWLQTDADLNYWQFCRSDGSHYDTSHYDTSHVCFSAPSDSFARQLAGQDGWIGYLGHDLNHFVVPYQSGQDEVKLVGNKFVVHISYWITSPGYASYECAIVSVRRRGGTHEGATIADQLVCKGQMMNLPQEMA